jgi:two-component system nitrate/nitrite response regulator NarL
LPHKSQDAQIRILVADSNPIHTQLLAEALARNTDFRVTLAKGSADLASRAAEVIPDIAVVSSYLDEDPSGGYSGIRKLNLSGLRTRCVMLLDSSKREAILEAFAAGARGIFHRHESLETLAHCIRQVHHGQVWANSEQMSYAVEALASAPQIRVVNARGVDLLSKRERDVVMSLAAGLSNREIGARLGLSQHTIKNHLLRIFEKLGVSTRVELLSLTLTQEAQRSPIRSFVVDLFEEEGAEAPRDISAYRHAADRGLNRAQVRMAELHLRGAGVEKDPIAAYMWYLIAEKTNTAMREKIVTDKRKLAETLSTEQILEAQRRASEKITMEAAESSSGGD